MTAPIRSQDEVEPAFGQVWEYMRTTVILLCRTPNDDRLWLGLMPDTWQILRWGGLGIEGRLPEWKLLDEGVE